MNWFYIAAAVVCLATLAAHGVLGTQHIARPLLDADLAPVPKYVALFCWLAVGLVVLVMTVGFAFAAFNEGVGPLVVALICLAAGAAILNLLVIFYGSQSAFDMPQWIFFALIAGLGIVGLAMSRR